MDWKLETVLLARLYTLLSKNNAFLKKEKN